MKIENLLSPFKNIFLIPVLIAVLFVSCKKDDTKPDDSVPEDVEKFFNLEVRRYLTDNYMQSQQGWFLVYSEDNELLINQKIENNKIYKFDTLSIPQEDLQV